MDEQDGKTRNAVIVGIDHVQIAIPRGFEDEARRFYCGKLAMTELEKPANLKKKGGLWLAAGRHQLHLGVLDPFSPATKAHPAFEVSGIEHFRKRLELAGVETRDEDELAGAIRFYVSDPFGNRIEFLERTR